LEHHSANQFLKAATNLNVVQPKLFQGSRQDDLRFSDCSVSVIQILDDADAAFRILGAGLRTVLSVTTTASTDECAQRFRVLTILPPVTALALGYPRSDFVRWHETDMPTALRDVRSQEQSGKHLLTVSSSV